MPCHTKQNPDNVDDNMISLFLKKNNSKVTEMTKLHITFCPHL